MILAFKYQCQLVLIWWKSYFRSKRSSLIWDKFVFPQQRSRVDLNRDKFCGSSSKTHLCFLVRDKFCVSSFNFVFPHQRSSFVFSRQRSTVDWGCGDCLQYQVPALIFDIEQVFMNYWILNLWHSYHHCRHIGQWSYSSLASSLKTVVGLIEFWRVPTFHWSDLNTQRCQKMQICDRLRFVKLLHFQGTFNVGVQNWIVGPKLLVHYKSKNILIN